jgi:hypothetical protein
MNDKYNPHEFYDRKVSSIVLMISCFKLKSFFYKVHLRCEAYCNKCYNRKHFKKNAKMLKCIVTPMCNKDKSREKNSSLS